MSRLSSFLHPAVVREEKDVIISNRFLDEAGKPVPVRIRALTQEENAELSRKSTRREKGKGGRAQEVFDGNEYTDRLIVAAVVDPDLTAKEACEGVGVLDPLKVPGKLFLLGEYQALVSEILALSGLDEEGTAAAADRDDAKN